MKKEYKINIDGKWTLEDLYLLPHTYSQVYGFIYSLQLIKDVNWGSHDDFNIDFDERILFTYTSQPWKGGYSAVNFYNYLKNLVPPKHRPQIKAIHYESPGFMELILFVPAAIAIKKIIVSFCAAGKSINSLYNDIYKGAQQRKLLQIDVKKKELELKEADLEFLNSSTKSLAKLLGFKNINELNKVTNNPVTSFKIILSFYRRIRILAKYTSKGKTKF
ncbi:MAG: hypothetical protein KKG47_17370 [Proteobacteria bacterium]|nr:hypothetical protein [Pseudomonadota bacterium]